MSSIEIFAPMEPKLIKEPFDSGEHIFEVKWDGVRCLSYMYSPREIELYNRRLNRRTEQYPERVSGLKEMKLQGIVLDGEVIALSEEGKPDFKKVLKRDLAKNPGYIKTVIEKVPVYYIIFDMVYLNGASIEFKPLKERKRLLNELVRETNLINLVDYTTCDGKALFKAVQKEELEGIVAKQLDSPYVKGRKSSFWQKIKTRKTLNAFIAGWKGWEGHIRSLLLGIYDTDTGDLYYIGSVGSGLDEQKKSKLLEYFKKNKSFKEITPFKNPPVKSKGGKYYWVAPEIEVKIEYSEWTQDLKLRHPVLKDFLNESLQR